MKKIFPLFAFMAMLVLFCGCRQVHSEKLAKEIEGANRECPMDLGMMGSMTSLEYDRDLSRVEVEIELNDPAILNGLKANRTLAHKALLLSFSRGEALNILEMVAKAGAGIQFKFTADSGNSLTINLLPDEVKDAIDNPLDEDEASSMLIETQVMMENMRCPYTVADGMRMTRVFDDGDAIVYCCEVNEDYYDMDIMEQNVAQIKDNVVEILNDPVMYNQATMLASQDKGFTYRYIGSRTGKMTDIAFTPSDIRRYISARN